MKQVITTERIPIKIWADDLEIQALQQAKNLANLPFTFKWISIMPDGHSGYGMPIGGVIATKGVVIPNAVGVDIGCGICACKTHLSEISTEKLKEVMSLIRQEIPLGMNHHKDSQSWDGFNMAPDILIIQNELESSRYQLCTLGGGNHFIEIQKDKDGWLWIMIHSGSRNFGFQIAKYYHEIAKNLNELWYSNISTPDLSFLPTQTKSGSDYIQSMNFALEFAKENRIRMMHKSRMCLEQILNISIAVEPYIDIHHNYATMEHHYGENVMVHRKGATSARLGEIGIIPGSQGTKSYIVRGLGNPESFTSCSHGAGRKMSRTGARENLKLDDEISRLDKQGIIHSIRNVNDLDEATGAYKDISIVMANQSDLIEIITELQPIAVIKAPSNVRKPK